MYVCKMLTFTFGHVHETKLTPKERGNSLNLLKNFPPNREEKPQHWNRISSKELARQEMALN